MRILAAAVLALLAIGWSTPDKSWAQAPAYAPPAARPAPATPAPSGIPSLAMTQAKHQTMFNASAGLRSTPIDGSLPARDCAKLTNAQGRTYYANACTQTIELRWCIQGAECEQGIAHMWTLAPNAVALVSEKQGVSTLNGACFGGNNLLVSPETANAGSYRCTARPLPILAQYSVATATIAAAPSPPENFEEPSTYRTGTQNAMAADLHNSCRTEREAEIRFWLQSSQRTNKTVEVDGYYTSMAGRTRSSAQSTINNLSSSTNSYGRLMVCLANARIRQLDRMKAGTTVATLQRAPYDPPVTYTPPPAYTPPAQASAPSRSSGGGGFGALLGAAADAYVASQQGRQQTYAPPQNTYGNSYTPPAQTGMSQAQINACNSEIFNLQSQAGSWGLPPGEANIRLARMQRDLFTGRCAGHPQAAAYIAGADRMTSTGQQTQARVAEQQRQAQLQAQQQAQQQAQMRAQQEAQQRQNQIAQQQQQERLRQQQQEAADRAPGGKKSYLSADGRQCVTQTGSRREDRSTASYRAIFYYMDFTNICDRNFSIYGEIRQTGRGLSSPDRATRSNGVGPRGTSFLVCEDDGRLNSCEGWLRWWTP